MTGRLLDTKPQIKVSLFKTISRQNIAGSKAVSTRYSGKSTSIDLTPFLNDGSSVVTSKSVRDPAGTFSLSFADRPHQSVVTSDKAPPSTALETIYGLVEPMDIIEIRMWSGIGAWPSGKEYPIKMRGFVSEVSRSQSMTDSGIPVRTVVVSGHDYGKIWQTMQIIYLQAYSLGKSLLSSYKFSEIFNVGAKSVVTAEEYISLIVDNVINPHLKDFMPDNGMPKELKKDISVKHGVITPAYQNAQGSIYDAMRQYGDVGIWNELYTEDREDGVYCVYRPTPALTADGDKKIQDDAPDPVYVTIPDDYITAMSTSRTDANIANFYWVFSQIGDMTTEIYRRTTAVTSDDPTAVIKDYPNSAEKYYGTRAMYGETTMGPDDADRMISGDSAANLDQQQGKLVDWVTFRRKSMLEMNRDNVVLERGSLKVKGGLMRDDGKECMKAGDYAKFKIGKVDSTGYIVQVTDEYIPYQSYTTTLSYERGTGFIKRSTMNGGQESPWLAEQATR